jgi:hypothetical protein
VIAGYRNASSQADKEGEEPGYSGAQDISEITIVTAASGSLYVEACYHLISETL